MTLYLRPHLHPQPPKKKKYKAEPLNANVWGVYMCLLYV